MALTLILVLLGLTLLLGGSDFLVKASCQIANKLGISPLIIGLTVVAFGTSAPELFVSVGASLKGNADFAIGNVVGSNIFNIFGIISVSAILATIKINKQILFKEMPIMLLAIGLFYLFSIDGYISRTNGIILFLGIIIYLGYIFIQSKKIKVPFVEEVEENTEKLWTIPFASFVIIISLAAMIFGSNLIVEYGSILAKYVGISDFVISVTLVAIGTSLPELATTFAAARKGFADLAIGNAVGSNIFNVFTVIGLTAIITPIKVDEKIINFDFPIMFFGCLAIWPFMLLRKKFGKIEALFMLSAYLIYVYFLIK